MTKKERAKKVSIVNLYPDKDRLRKFGDKLRGPCPFHGDEAHPNFFIYTKTNTFNCFAGCGGGDSISYVMKRDNCSFVEALETLTEK